MICFSDHAVSICSRPSRDSSDMMSTWNGARGFSAFISRRKPGLFANSAPLMARLCTGRTAVAVAESRLTTRTS